MKLSYIHGFVAAIALAFVSVLATAAPPDFQLELMQLDAGPGETIAPYLADEVAFVAVGDARAFMALPADGYQIERMSETNELPLQPPIPAALHCQGVGVFVDTQGSPMGVTVEA